MGRGKCQHKRTDTTEPDGTVWIHSSDAWDGEDCVSGECLGLTCQEPLGGSAVVELRSNWADQDGVSWTNVGSLGDAYTAALGRSFPDLAYNIVEGRYYNTFNGSNIARGSITPSITGSDPRAVEVVIRSSHTKLHSCVVSLGDSTIPGNAFQPGVGS